jgi:iron(III) transport system substrate-binding protein
LVPVVAGACGGAATSSGSSGRESAALGSQASANALNALYQQAQKNGETQVVVYGPDAPTLKAVYDQFKKRFPSITVQGQLLTGTQLNTRIDNEFLSGQHTADLLGVPGNVIWRAYTKNQLATYAPVAAQGLQGTYQVVGPQSTWATPYAKLSGILYNTSLVGGAEAPKSYAALLESKWRGKVAITDPRQVGATSSILIQLQHAKLVPANYVQRFRSQNPVVVPHAPQVSQMVGSGQLPLGLPYGVEAVMQDQRKGAPEALDLSLAEGAGVSHASVGVLKGAPHPNAAQLLEAWMFTPEGQKALAADGFYGTMPNSPAPTGFPDLSQVKVIPEPSPAQLDSVLNAGIGNLAQEWGG